MKIKGKHLTVSERLAWERKRKERSEKWGEWGDVAKGFVFAFAIIYIVAHVVIAFCDGRFNL